MPQQGKYTAADLASDPMAPQDAQAQQPERSMLGKIGDAGLDLLKGVGEGALHTITGTDEWAQKHLPAFMTTPIGQAATPENQQKALAYERELERPANATQKIGKIGEQAGEYLIPGAGEEKIAASAGNVLSKIPKLAGVAPLVGKLGASALASGAVNKIQGGSFGGGAAAGAIGAGVGAGLKSVAAPLAEKAMGVRAVDRAFGRTPGQAILDETTGIKPGTIASQASDKVGKYSTDLDTAAKTSQNFVNLQPARDLVESLADTASKRNNKSTVKEIEELGNQLDHRGQTPIGPLVSADEGLALRRGVDDLQTSWGPNQEKDFTSRAVDSTRGLMNDELEKAIPDYKGMTGKISTLLPVAKRAGATDLNESLAARVLTRGAARTGAGALGIAGTIAGQAAGGLPGAVLGGITGMVGPELLTHPTTLMGASRAFNSKALEKLVLPGGRGVLLQLGQRRDPDQ